MTPAAWERKRAVLSAASVFEALAIFRVCGVVGVGGLLDGEMIDGVRSAVLDEWAQFGPQLASFRARQPDSNKWPKVVVPNKLEVRGDQRFELKLPSAHPAFYDAGLVDNAGLLSLVHAFLAVDNVELDTFSTVMSLPQAKRGRWHSDVEDPYAACHPPVMTWRRC